MDYTAGQKRIMDTALDLFSSKGYDATSISDICDAIGIKKASLYSHFKSKQAVLDAIIEDSTAYYEEHSFIGNNTIFEHDTVNSDILLDYINRHIQFLIYDEKVYKVRHFLIIEQFKNKDLCLLQEKCNYTYIMSFSKKLIEKLIEKRIFKDLDPMILAAQLMSVVLVQINRIDRNPNIEQEALEIIKKHIILFFDTYKVK